MKEIILFLQNKQYFRAMSENGPSSLVYIKAKESYPKKEKLFLVSPL